MDVKDGLWNRIKTESWVFKIERRHLVALWGWGWALLVLLTVNPVGLGILRLATILIILTLWLGALLLFWKTKVVRYICVGFFLIVMILIISPGRNVDPNRVRTLYVQELIGYEGTPYVWGGENKLGIDCSGLVREGLIHVNLKLGLRTINPLLIRRALSMWWYDASAEALGKEYRHLTQLRYQASSINGLDYSNIRTGDIAVTVGHGFGVHTLAYIGGHTWIEAHPSYGKTMKVRVPASSPWYDVPVYILEWQQFEVH